MSASVARMSGATSGTIIQIPACRSAHAGYLLVGIRWLGIANSMKWIFSNQAGDFIGRCV